MALLYKVLANMAMASGALFAGTEVVYGANIATVPSCIAQCTQAYKWLMFGCDQHYLDIYKACHHMT